MELIEQLRTEELAGIISMVSAMDCITEFAMWANEGMNTEQWATLCDLLDDEWPAMGRMLSGYIFGATTDDAEEEMGERLRNDRIENHQPLMYHYNKPIYTI